MKAFGNDKPRTARETAVHFLTRIEREGAFADRLLSSKLVEDLGPRDRLFLRELVLGVLRWKRWLDYIVGTYYDKGIGALNMDILNMLRIGLYQLAKMDSVPDFAAVDQSVEMARRSFGKGPAGLVNAILRRFLREGIPDWGDIAVVERLSIEYSCPAWIVRRWIDSFDMETAEAILVSSCKKNTVTIRVNTLRSDADALAGQLSAAGFEVSAVAGISGYLDIAKGTGLFDTDAYRDGLFTAQDPVAGMAAMMLDPQRGDTVLDLCCAPGGKTTHIAELAGDDLEITAVDINPKRLGLVKSAVHRLGLKSVVCAEGDAVQFGADTDAVYDRALCDVPCTGTGVFSKRPDMKWRRTVEDIGRMSALQNDILGSAAQLVKPGGVLVYSTCSLEPEENGAVIDRFTAKYDFTVERDSRFREYETENGYLTLPQRMHGSGAFVSKLRRK